MHQRLGQQGPLLHSSREGLAQNLSFVFQISCGKTTIDFRVSFFRRRTVCGSKQLNEFIDSQVVVYGREIGHVAKHASDVFGFV